MRTTFIPTIILSLCLQAASQQTPPSAPTAPPPPGSVPPTTPSPVAPPSQNPPANQPAPTQPPNPVTPPAAQPAPGINAPTVAPQPQNQVVSSNPPLVVFTNAFAGSNLVLNFNITNTLATMSPVQVRAVRQVQVSLDSLQRSAANLRNTPNLQQHIAQNPRMQQQLQLVANQINALAQGSVRPSQDIVQRLTYDLFRVFVFARLTQDQQLVLSVVVNQVANSANLTPAQVQDSINTGQVVLQSSGAPLAIVHPVTCDLHAVAFELQPNLVQ